MAIARETQEETKASFLLGEKKQFISFRSQFAKF